MGNLTSSKDATRLEAIAIRLEAITTSSKDATSGWVSTIVCHVSHGTSFTRRTSHVWPNSSEALATARRKHHMMGSVCTCRPGNPNNQKFSDVSTN